MLSRFGIKGKLLLLCCLLSLFTVGVGAVGISALQGVTKNYETVANINLPNIQSLGSMLGAFRRAQVTTQSLAIEGVTPEMAKTAMEKSSESIADFNEEVKAYLAQPFQPGELELYKKVEAIWIDFNKSVTAVQDAYRAKDRAKTAQIALGDLSENGTVFRKHIKALIDFHDKLAEATVAHSRSEATRSNTVSVTLIIAGFSVAMTLGYLFSRALSNTLNDIASSLSSGANEVASASTQIASSSEELSASVTEQAAALQETAASIEEMSAMVTKNTENCTKSTELSGQSSGSATNGKKIVGDMIVAIQEINTSNAEMAAEIETSNQEISSIIKVIAEIGNKTKVINDIVFQTKLLSFNASVEAARAGEHGKGFAVVAEEVGKLAEMSGNASREISGMLEESISKVEGIVTNMKTKVERSVANGKTKVETGAQIAQECGEVLDSIVGSVSQVNVTVEEIATASKEQDHGVREVSKAMAQLDQVTQQNSSACQQTASAAEELSAQAEILRSSVTRLMNTVQGEGAVAQFAPPSGRTRSAVAKKAPAPVIPIQRAAARTEKHEAKGGATRMLATGTSGSIPHSGDSRFEDV